MNRPKKSLGQNFLQDTNVAQKIVRVFNPQPGEHVVEIGPGKGALTQFLVQHLSHLTAIEVDDDLAPALQTTYGEKLTLLHTDVLDVDLHTLIPSSDAKLRIIGNIPYNITSPILFHVIDACDVVKDLTIMLQTEVAQRLVARPRTKEYGILSVVTQYYSTPKIQFLVSRNSFFPIPAVTSTVIRLDFETPFAMRAQHDDLFRMIVRRTFGKRRKTLRNGLRGMDIPMSELEKLSIDLEQRPEELSVGQFVTLSDELSHLREQILSASPALNPT